MQSADEEPIPPAPREAVALLLPGRGYARLSTMRISLHCSAATLLLLLAVPVHAQPQFADPDFDTSVERPAYTDGGPTVVIDEAHKNFHTLDGRYAPFANLLRNDGYTVQGGRSTFEPATLTDVDVLVIANAGSANGGPTSEPAFTDRECDVIQDWVRSGGSLLLIADHTPFGTAAENLGSRFGVDMGKGWVFEGSVADDSLTTELMFSAENGLLGDHPIVRGRSADEAVTRVRSFAGQSLGVPNDATVLMRLGKTTREAASNAALQDVANSVAGARADPVGGRAQGLAFAFGDGRVVVLGEASMLSAQVAILGDPPREFKAGMNVPGADNPQFALNVLRWLSGALN
jgi:hypothetical protein